MKVDLMRETSKKFALPLPPEQITSLRVWHCKYTSLEAIKQCVNLQELVIATIPDDSIDFLTGLKQLEYLSILHLPKVSSLSALSGLDALTCLSLETLPSWDASRKRTIVDSIEPLSALPLLKHVELLGVLPSNLSLQPLTSTSKLETARLLGYPAPEVERFYTLTRVKNSFNPRSSFS